MASIDQRIVELKFNAKQFQTGIQAALASLDNLKKNLNLNKAASEFDKVEKASKKITFNDLYASVDSISNRFSTFGVVAMSALNQITISAMQTGKKLLSALTAPLIEGGKRRALNIEQAKFQIEGLGFTWEQVEDDISYGVLNTAYGLDAAAKAASQLLASQVKVGDEMKASLRGISGVAAMTSSEYEDIANIFTTVAGNGRLMGDQLMQLSSRGINAAAALGKYLHKNEAEVREMVSKGLIDFQTFANAMDWNFGEHATKANETFTGSLSNMKAALARIGAEIASPAYGHLREIFNSLTPIINGVKIALTPLIDTIKEGMKYVANFATTLLDGLGGKDGVAGKLSPAIEKFNRILKAFGSLILGIAKIIRGVVSPIFSAFTEVLGGDLLDAIGGALEIMAKFANSLAFNDRMMGNLKKTFLGIFTIVKVLFNIITSIVSVVSDVLLSVFSGVFGFIADVLLTITGYIGTLVVKIYDFIMQLYNLKTVQDLISVIASIFNTLRDAVTKVYWTFRNLVGVILDSTFESALWIFDKIALAILTVARFIDTAIQKTIEFIRWFSQLPQIRRFVSQLRDAFRYLRDTIGETAIKLKDKFVEAFNKAKPIVMNFVNTVKSLIQQYARIPTLQEVIIGVQKLMTRIFEGAIKIFFGAKEILGKIIDKVNEIAGVSLRGIVENFGKLRDKIAEVIDVSGKLEFLKSAIAGIRDGAAFAMEGTGTFLGKIKEKITQFVEWIKGKFRELTMDDIISAGIGASFIAFLINLAKFTSTAEKFTKTLTNVVGFVENIQKSVTGVLDSFAEINKAKAKAVKYEAMAKMIQSVALLAGAVALLATMDAKRVRESAAVLLILAGSIILLSGVMNMMSAKAKPAVVEKTAIQLISAAGSLFILCGALKLLSTVPAEKIKTSLLAITLLMIEMIAFVVVVNKLAPKMNKGAFSMLAMAGSILLLSRAMSEIGSMNPQDIVISMGVMSVLMIALGVMTKLSDKAKLSKSSAISILAIVIAMRMMLSAIKTLAKMDATTINTGIYRLIEIMGSLSLLLIATRLAGKNASKAGISIFFISVAMNVMARAIREMASIDDGMLGQATKSVNEILKVFALITLMTKFAGANAVKAGTAIVMMSTSLLIIAGAMMLLSRLSEDDLTRTTIVIDSILGMFALVVGATSLMKKANKTMKTMMITIGILVGSIAILALINPENLKAASTAISMVMGTFALLVASTKFLNNTKRLRKSLVPLLGVVVILAAIIGALGAIPMGNDIVSIATALSELMIVFTYMAAVFGLLSKLNVKINIGLVAQLAGAIDLFIVIIGALIAALGWISSQIPELKTFLDEGIVILQKIGQGIGEFIGGLVGGIAVGVSATLVDLADNLTKFVKALQPFMEEAKKIDDSAVDACVKLLEMVALFAAADFINGLDVFSGSAVDTLEDELPRIGEALSSFSESVSTVDTSAMKNGVDAAKSLAEISLLVSEGGLMDAIFGSSNEGLAAFSENLPAFGKALKDYGDAVDGINSEAIKNSVEPAKSIIEISNMINGEGGLLQDVLGSNAEGISLLSSNLENFGKALVAYGDSVSSLDSEAIKNSVEPAKALVEISNMINGEGGLLQDVIGSNAEGLSLLTENLENFGDSLNTYGESVSDLNAEAIKNSVEPAKALVEISNMINGEGGLVQGFLGSTGEGLEYFSNNLSLLGEGMRKYGEEVSTMNGEAITASLPPLRSLIEAADMIGPEGGALGLFVGSDALGLVMFATNLPYFGLGLASFAAITSGIDPGPFVIAAVAANLLAEAASYIPPEGGVYALFVGSSAGAFSNFIGNLGDFGQGIKDFYEKTKSIKNIKAFMTAAKVAAILADIYANMDPEGGVLDFWFNGTKGQTFETLSENLSSFAEGILDFYKVAQQIENLDKLEMMVSIASKLKDIYNGLEPSGSVWQFFTGSKNDSFETLGDNLSSLAASMKDAADKLSGTSLAGLDTMAKSLYMLKQVADSSDVLSGLSGLGSNIRDFSKDLAEFLEYLKFCDFSILDDVVDAFDKIKEAASKWTDFPDIRSPLEGFIQTIKNAGDRLVQNFVNSLGEGAHIAADMSVKMVSKAVIEALKYITSKLNDFRAKGVEMIRYLAKGMMESVSILDSAVRAVTGNLSDKLKSVYDAGTNAGSNVMAGLKAGIESNAWGPANAAYDAGVRVIAKLNQGLGNASPSKKGRAAGRFLDLGLMYGILDYAHKVIGAVKDMTDDVIDETDEWSMLSFFDDFDLSPVITPTLDTSEVDRGLLRMNSQFASSRGIPLSTQGLYMSSAFGSITQARNLRELELQNRTPYQVVNNYDMTQNNYSPKALSRIDIYRDTRTQFSRLKEVTKQ